MKKLEEIAKAWITALNPSDYQKDRALLRSITCDGCEHKAYNDELKFNYCAACNCPLAGKIYSPVNSCPEKKWKHEIKHTDDIFLPMEAQGDKRLYNPSSCSEVIISSTKDVIFTTDESMYTYNMKQLLEINPADIVAFNED